jgi:hypothetical protein
MLARLVIPVGGFLFLLIVIGYRTFFRKQRRSYTLGAVSEHWLMEQRRER